MCCFHALKVSYLCLSLVLNIILILSTAIKFLLYNQNICHNGFKFGKTYYFFCSKGNKFSTFEESFHSQGIFPQSKNFSIVEEFFHSEVIFSQLKNFATVMEFFHSKGIFPQPRKFLTKKIYRQGSFSRKIFLDLGSFPQAKIFTQSKNFLQTKIKKVF